MINELEAAVGNISNSFISSDHTIGNMGGHKIAPV